MDFKKYYIFLVLFALCTLSVYSQDVRTVVINATTTSSTYRTDSSTVEIIREQKSISNIEVHFQFDKHEFVPEYMGNDVSLQNFANLIDSIGVERIDSVVVVSQSSPEGVYKHNMKLSKRRADTMRRIISERHPEIVDKLFVHPDGESWQQLRELVKKDPLIKNTTRDKILSVIDANVGIETKKWRMQQLPIYRYLRTTHYPRIRNSMFCVLYYSESIFQTMDSVASKEEIVEVVDTVPVVEVPDTVPAEPAPAPSWCPRLHFKSNALGLSMGISNAAVEIDFAKHWSFTFPLYYSAWNYFNERIKFRTLAFQPEVRYWFSEENNKFFLGAHFSYAQYNIAVAGDYRYQDHNMEKPALGGGISVGYRLPLSKDHRWNVEFTLGAGVYPLHYDIFENTPDTKDGLLLDSRKMTYWGLDNAGITFSYALDLKKKGGKK